MKELMQFMYLLLLPISYGLYEDQIGRFDWKQEYIGIATHASIETNLFNGRFLIVGTADNVIASVSLETGKLLWRQVLERRANRLLSHFKLSHLLITPDHNVLSVQGSLVRTWDIVAGSLISEVQCRHVSSNNILNSFVLYADGVLGIVEILHNSSLLVSRFSISTGKLMDKKEEKVDWMNTNAKCIASKEYFICYSEVEFNLRYFRVSNPVFKVETIGVEELKVSGNVSLQEVPGYLKETFIILRNINISAVFRIGKLGISLIKIIDPDWQSVTICEAGNQISLYSYDGENLYVSDLNSNKDLRQFNVELNINVHGERGVLWLWALGFPQERGGYITEILVSGADHSLALYSSGSCVWVREEALASIIAVEMIELPISPLGILCEKELQETGSLVGMLVQRLSIQVTQLYKGLLWNLGFGENDTTSGKMDMKRDELSLHKIVVVVTASGKTFGIHNKDGKIIWHLNIPNIAPFEGFGGYGHEKLMLYVQRNVKHHPFTPLCLLVGRNKSDGRGILVSFNPISGELISVKNLQNSILQTTLIPYVNEMFIHPVLVLLDGASKLLVFPENATDIVTKFKNRIYLFTSNVRRGVISGYSLYQSTDKILQVESTWLIHIPLHQVITHIVGKSLFEKVHSQGYVMGDRGVLYKYLNPNLVAVVTEGIEPMHQNIINLYLIDGITGEIVHSATHKKRRGPVHIVHSENWIVYSLYNEKARRYEIASMELFVSKFENYSTSFSSLSAISGPVIKVQAFIFPSGINSMCHTVTEKGITNKNLLIGLHSGGVLELPRTYLNPRRPVIPTLEHTDETLLPYIPEIPVYSEAIINYYQALQGIKGIFTSPSGLESTSLVFVYGLDLFYTRVSPSKNFDVLKDDFDHCFICIVLVSLFLASYITKLMAERKALKQSWK